MGLISTSPNLMLSEENGNRESTQRPCPRIPKGLRPTRETIRKHKGHKPGYIQTTLFALPEPNKNAGRTAPPSEGSVEYCPPSFRNGHAARKRGDASSSITQQLLFPVSKIPCTVQEAAVAGISWSLNFWHSPEFYELAHEVPHRKPLPWSSHGPVRCTRCKANRSASSKFSWQPASFLTQSERRLRTQKHAWGILFRRSPFLGWLNGKPPGTGAFKLVEMGPEVVGILHRRCRGCDSELWEILASPRQTRLPTAPSVKPVFEEGVF